MQIAYWFYPAPRRHYLSDRSVFIEVHPVDANFPMHTGAVVEIILIYTMINDVPFISSGYLND